MRVSDRIFGAVIVLGSLVYIASASQIAAPFFSDPLGSKSFPIAVGIVAALCGAVMVASPDAEPEWPALRSLGALAISTIMLVGYAYTLRPLGFLLPTAVVAGVLSYQISPRPLAAILTGIGLSIGLYVLFAFVFDLSLQGLPRAWS